MENNKITIGSLSVSQAPHITTKLDTAKTMQNVLIALIPAVLVSTFMFGIRVLVLTAVCMAACAFFEWGYEKLMHKKVTIQDCSACVTGAILACNMPANFPFWMAIIGCFVAIVIVKQLYGGLGKNFANPAIVGRIVLLLSFTTQMTTWPIAGAGFGWVTPTEIDGVASATPLGLLAEEGAGLANLGDMFIGKTGGAMGEVCAIAVIIGGVYLIWKKIISPIIPCTFIATVFVIALIYYGVKGGAGDYNAIQMALYHILGGGVMFGAFFCATDYVTSPVMPQGKYIFGIGCGAVTMLIRLLASYPEGVSFAILLMNVCTPLIDSFVTKRYYDRLYGPKKEAKK
ncbi:MAG: RnfABCDGE type electron transport complex subunit D [Eubacterium sp.]|nr:RnfABCDGE type electron transport complex subunit D [Eubacterium sp.]